MKIDVSSPHPFKLFSKCSTPLSFIKLLPNSFVNVLLPSQIFSTKLKIQMNSFLSYLLTPHSNTFIVTRNLGIEGLRRIPKEYSVKPMVQGRLHEKTERYVPLTFYQHLSRKGEYELFILTGPFGISSSTALLSMISNVITLYSGQQEDEAGAKHSRIKPGQTWVNSPDLLSIYYMLLTGWILHIHYLTWIFIKFLRVKAIRIIFL